MVGGVAAPLMPAPQADGGFSNYMQPSRGRRCPARDADFAGSPSAVTGRFHDALYDGEMRTCNVTSGLERCLVCDALGAIDALAKGRPRQPLRPTGGLLAHDFTDDQSDFCHPRPTAALRRVGWPDDDTARFEDSLSDFLKSTDTFAPSRDLTVRPYEQQKVSILQSDFALVQVLSVLDGDTLVVAQNPDKYIIGDDPDL